MGQAHDARAIPRRRRPAEGEGPFKQRLRRLLDVAQRHRNALVLLRACLEQATGPGRTRVGH